MSRLRRRMRRILLNSIADLSVLVKRYMAVPRLRSYSEGFGVTTFVNTQRVHAVVGRTGRYGTITRFELASHYESHH